MKVRFFPDFVVIFADFHEICSDFFRISRKPLQLLEISRFRFNFSMIIPEIHLMFDLIFFNFILFYFQFSHRYHAPASRQSREAANHDGEPRGHPGSRDSPRRSRGSCRRTAPTAWSEWPGATPGPACSPGRQGAASIASPGRARTWPRSSNFELFQFPIPVLVI